MKVLVNNLSRIRPMDAIHPRWPIEDRLLKGGAKDRFVNDQASPT